MALTWDVSKIKNHEVVTTHPEDEKRWNPVTEALVWACLAVGISEITEENWKDFHTRVRLYEGLNDPFLDEPMSVKNVYQHIGLSTNVSNMTMNQFINKAVKIYNQFFSRMYERVQEECDSE